MPLPSIAVIRRSHNHALSVRLLGLNAQNLPLAKCIPPGSETVLSFMGGAKAASSAAAKEKMAAVETTEAGQQLERAVAADRARAALPSFPYRAEGSPEVEAGRAQAEAHLRQTVCDMHELSAISIG
jgi:hypothetical protein